MWDKTISVHKSEGIASERPYTQTPRLRKNLTSHHCPLTSVCVVEISVSCSNTVILDEVAPTQVWETLPWETLLLILGSKWSDPHWQQVCMSTNFQSRFSGMASFPMSVLDAKAKAWRVSLHCFLKGRSTSP